MATSSELYKYEGRMLNDYRFKLQSHVVARQMQILDRQKVQIVGGFVGDVLLMILVVLAIYDLWTRHK